MDYPSRRQFPVRPRPCVGEDFKSYVLRIAFRNGYENINIINRIVGITVSKACFDINSVVHKRFVGEIALLLRIQSETLLAHFDESTVYHYDANRAVKDCTTPDIKLCLDCIKSDGFIHKTWFEAHHTYCSTHQKPLIDCCPNCHAKFSWKSDVFEKCPECELKWSNYSVMPAQKPIYFAVLEKLSGASKIEYLLALYQAYVYSMRPLDAMHITYRHFPREQGFVHTHFEQAYALLTDKQYAANIETIRYRYFSSNSELTQFNDSQLLKISKLDNLNYIAHLPLSTLAIDSNLIEEKSAVTNYRNREVIGDECYHFQVGLYTLAKILNLGTNILTHLVKSRAIPEISGSVNAQFFLFDLRKIDDFISNIIKNSSDLNTSSILSFKEAEILMQHSNMDSAQLLVAMLNGDIAYQMDNFDDSPFFQYCNFDKMALSQFIENRFPETITDILNKNKIQKFCSISESQFQYFKLLFSRDLIVAHSGMSYIKPEVLSEFFRTKLFLNRWCKLNNMELDSTVADLAIKGIKPIVYSNRILKIYFFEKTKELNNYLMNQN